MRKGLTLIEVLIVVAILGLLLTALFFYALPQVARGRDGKRLSDLDKLKVVFEDYYNDNACYPPRTVLDDYCGGGGSTVLDGYINTVPCDPRTREPYLYQLIAVEADPTCPTRGYRLLTDLERNGSEASIAINCGGVNGCGFVVGETIYDYGIAQGAAISFVGSPPELGGGGGTGEDWCCVLSTQTCSAIINGFPSSCDRDYHGFGSATACTSNCIQ